MVCMVEVIVCMLVIVGGDGAFYGSDGRKEGNVLFNDALNTFYLRLNGVRHG